MGDRISIIVSTFNRRKKLERLLASFNRLIHPCPLEFIIVDNRSNDGTDETVRQWIKENSSTEVKFYINPVISPLVKSRNAGISLSSGNIIAFTDDDCVVDSLWIDRLYHRLIASPPHIVGVGGKVLPCRDDIYSQYYTVYRILEPPEHVNAVIGASCIFWKQPVIDAGLFDEYFLSPGGEEIALCMKLWSRGNRFSYEEEALVRHDYRRGLRAFYRSMYRDGHGERLIFLSYPEQYLGYLPYPEQLYNHLAFRHRFVFLAVFLLRMAGGILLQYPFLRCRGLPLLKRVKLTGLYACAQFSYHLGRGTFSGKLVQHVRKFHEDNPEIVLPGIPFSA